MSQWTREITHALGFNEQHSEPGSGAALAVSFGIARTGPVQHLSRKRGHFHP